MAILDRVLSQLMSSLSMDLAEAGLRRQRGGIARGVAWAEASGRSGDGAWLELRLHHRPTDRRLDAGLLAYEPLSRGGKTVVLGERTAAYRFDAEEVSDRLVDDVHDWLARSRTGGQSAEPLGYR
ncbi:MAG: hypothetical protein U0821_01485 [Chloroflexota bacterium]